MRGINFAISMGLALLLPMLITYGVNLIQPPPEMADYHIIERGGPLPEDSPEAHAERQRIYQEEDRNYMAALRDHEAIFFFVALPIGVILVISGAVIKVPAVGIGLAFGGVFTLILGYGSYWDQLSDLIKFVSLLVALCLLIFTAYRIYAVQGSKGPP